MARVPATETAEDRVVRELQEEDDAAIESITARSGPPPDTKRASEAEEDALYAFEDRNVAADRDAFARQLMTQGITPEQANSLWLLKVRPDWAPHYQQPTQDAQRADMLARAAQYPFRWGLFDDVADPRERVAKAERLDRRYQRQHAAQQEQMAQQAVTVPPVEGG